MSLNLFDAFTYLFKQKNWFVKILIGSILFFFVKIIALAMDVFNSEALPKIGLELIHMDTWVSALAVLVLNFGALILLVFAIWMHVTVFGYLITAIRRYMRNQEDAIPDWDTVMGKLFVRGFKAFIASFIIISAIIFIGSMLYIPTLFVFGLDFWGPFASFTGKVVGFTILFLLVYMVVLCPALLMSFCEKDRFLAAFNFVRARQLALKSIKNYALMLLMLAVVVVMIAASIALLSHAKIGILVLPVVCFYLFIVFGNIIGQYYVSYCKE